MAKGSYKIFGDENKQKERMIEDIRGLFKVKDSISITACQNVLDEISWKYTETGKNKNLCCKYWSEKAIERYEKNIKDKDNKDKNKGLVHEHVIPRNIFINTILKRIKEGKELTSEELKKIDERLIACVITKDEDKRLPKNTMSGKEVGNNFFKIEDIWNRYRGKGIRVYEVKCKKEGRKTVLDLETKKEFDLKKKQ